MKYIRTKDGVHKIYDTHNGAINHWGYKVNKDLTILLDKESIKNSKTADTIEELCDQFVYVTNNGNHYVKNNHDAIHYFIGEERPVSYYGAIWTDKGLIYVAKMNNKGEWELL